MGVCVLFLLSCLAQLWEAQAAWTDCRGCEPQTAPKEAPQLTGPAFFSLLGLHQVSVLPYPEPSAAGGKSLVHPDFPQSIWVWCSWK
ncbi:hypothetical protein EK904_009430 [Melospiza melodia maxima]|nr:hypothetical protein EK904_009430 [Melospiza melodia maxima]